MFRRISKICKTYKSHSSCTIWSQSIRIELKSNHQLVSFQTGASERKLLTEGEVLLVKQSWRFADVKITPLVQSIFQGIPAKVPFVGKIEGCSEKGEFIPEQVPFVEGIVKLNWLNWVAFKLSRGTTWPRDDKYCALEWWYSALWKV